MTARGVLLLGVLTLVAVVLALVLGSRTAGVPAERDSEPLLPGLKEQVNQIGAVDIRGADGSVLVSLRREDERWRVREKDNYEADFELVHDLLRNLATGSRVSERTANPAWYARLGVADVGHPEASGLQVELPGSGLPSLIVGQPDSADVGRFVRLVGEERAWLSDRQLDLPADAVGWLERSVMDIPASQLTEVTLLHPDGDTVRLRAAENESEDWVLMNVPDGREAAPMWQLRPVANGLANIVLEDVRRHRELPEESVRALYVTRDGLNFVATLFEDEDGHWVHFTVSAEVTASDDDELDEDDARISVDAVAVDGRLSPWEFRLTERKFDNMTRRLEDLLADAD